MTTDAWLATFTTAERRVLDLLVHGACDKEISTVLGITVQTVKYHLANMRDKHDLHSRSELVAMHWQHHLREAQAEVQRLTSLVAAGADGP